jgi:hypothetical protein
MRTVHATWAPAFLGVVGLLLSIFGAGCGPGEAKAPNPTKPIDERRAIEVIRRAMKSEGISPAGGRDERFATRSGSLHIDVGAEGKQFGVAYITDEDAKDLAENVTPNKKDEKLKIVTVGDGKGRVLLLFQQNYLFDDLTGELHEQTMITAENALARDVRDFVTYAKSKGFE